jgi:hypothetical protein
VIGELRLARIVDEQVNAPERGARGVGQCAALGVVGDVGLDRDRSVSDLRRQRLGGVAAGGIVDNASHAARGQRPHHRRADSGAAAGDDRHHALHRVGHFASPKKPVFENCVWHSRGGSHSWKA